MFRQKEKPEKHIEDIDTLIGENIEINGQIKGVGTIRVDGIIEGDIDYDGNIVIGETGKVSGNIKGEDISLAGTVQGNITSNTKLTLLPSSTLIGDVKSSSLVIHENAKFEGSSKMIEDKNLEYVSDK